jgi:hypothetical protein
MFFTEIDCAPPDRPTFTSPNGAELGVTMKSPTTPVAVRVVC